MPLRINVPSPLRSSDPSPGIDSPTLSENSNDAPLVVLTAKLPASTTGAEIEFVPPRTVTRIGLPLLSKVSVPPAPGMIAYPPLPELLKVSPPAVCGVSRLTERVELGALPKTAFSPGFCGPRLSQLPGVPQLPLAVEVQMDVPL